MLAIAPIGHNGGPELDEGRQQSTRTRWAKALFADPTTPPYVMAIAWAVHWYSNADGTGAALSNDQLQLICGISESTATRGKKWLRDKGYVQLTIGKHHEKTRFRLVLPDPSRVVEETTHQGSHADDPRVVRETTLPSRVVTQTSQGSHADDRRVVTQTTLSSKDNQDSIQEKKALARGRQDDRRNFWQEALNPQSGDVLFERGKLTLLNGARIYWLNKFDSDEARLDLALIQIAPALQPNSQRSLQVQVEGQLAKIVAQRMDQDRRYLEAAAKKKKETAEAPKVESATDKIRRIGEAAEERMRQKRGARP